MLFITLMTKVSDTAEANTTGKLLWSNREGLIGDYGAGLVGVKNTTDEATQYEEHRSLPPLPRR